MPKLISVILPVYNGGNFLEESIESILNQTYQNFEFIIINDGSTDNSHQIIDKYLENKKIIYVSRENKGLVQTLNEALRLSKGEFIARMDQDDICYPNRLESQIKFMDRNKLDVCGCNYEIIDEVGNYLKTKIVEKENFEFLLSAMMVPFIHPSVMYKNFFNDKKINYGGDNFNINAEDYDLWVRIFEKNLKFGNLDEILIKYRYVKSSLSRINKKNIFQEVYFRCNKFNLTNKKTLLKKYSTIAKKKTNKSFKVIIFKSAFNFIKINGLNFTILKLFFKLNPIYSFIGLLLFVKQEILFKYYKTIKLNG